MDFFSRRSQKRNAIGSASAGGAAVVGHQGAGSKGPRLLNLSPLAQLRAGKLPVRILQLFMGLTAMGVGLSLMVRSGLGNLPWDVLHYGLAIHFPLSIGVIIILASLVVLLGWIPLRQAPGFGTISNAIWIGVVADATLLHLPEAPSLVWQIVFMLSGIVMNGLATAMYIGAQLGPGPRDGLMTGLARITGASIRSVRTGIEAVVVVVGWLIGGVLGIGTLLFAVSIGPLTQFFLPYFTVDLGQEEMEVSAAQAPARDQN